MMSRSWLANGVQGRHVLAALCGFFGLMLLANALFVYFAVSTFSGGDTSKPYQKGLHYNQTIAADARQAERSWQPEIAYDDQTGLLSLSIHDSAGAVVSGLHVSVKLGRPATDKDDRRVILKESPAGVYGATVELDPGLWMISIASRHTGEARASAYRLKRRLLVTERP